MAFSFDVASNIPRLNQSGTDTGLAGISTAINALPSVERSTTFTTIAMRKPPIANGMWYRCSTSGTSAATAPTYNPVLGSTTTDGTSVWTAFKAPDIQTLGTTNHYYMPDIRMAINGTLTNANVQQQNFTCFDLIIFTGNFTSGAWASDGVTPLYDGVHFAAVRSSTSGADGTSMSLQSGGQFTFIGGEIQTAGGVTFDNGTTPRSYLTRWRNTKEYGASSARFRSSTVNAIFQNVETYDFAFDLFRMPTVPPSIKARGSEYVYQYVGASAGGADAKFSASALENVDGTYDFDNYFGGWIELFNCAKGANLNVVSQFPNSSIWVKHLVPLFQDIKITAKDSAGNLLENIRFNATDSPSTSPTVLFTTASSLKTWDFRNTFKYETTTNASGIALSSPALQAWYWEGTFRKNLRFPNSTANYQGRAYNYKTMNVSVVLGSNSIQDVSAGLNSLDTATTVTETAASAITGISLTPQGTTGGTIVISSNKTYQDIWNYYRWWVSQFANKTSDDVFTCIGGTLYIGNWEVVVNAGVTLSDSTNITKLQSATFISIIDSATMPYLFNAGGVLQPTGVLVPSTVLGVLDTYTGAGAINAIYQDSTGTSKIIEINTASAGYSLCVYKANGSTKYFASNVASGTYKVYFTPSETGNVFIAAENYGQKRTEDTIILVGGFIYYNVTDQEDVGITDSKAIASAYTTLSTTSQIYDATAYFRLSETGIKLGQLVARDGAYLDFGNFNVKIKDDASTIVGVATGTITYKSIVINESTKYNAMKATPPKTITPTDTEIINVLIEDANGDSQLSILGGDNLGYEIWKVTTATATDDYATGTLLTTLANNSAPYRFIGISGFDIVGRDVSSGVRRRSSMLKGTYEQAFYVGNQIQLATDAPQLLSTIDKIDELTLKVDTNLDVKVSTRATPQQVWEYITRTLTSSGASGATLAEIEASTILAKEATSEAIKLKTNKMEFNASNHIAANVHQLQAGAITSIQNGLAVESTSQSIKTKVDTLNNTDLTGIATTTDVTTAKDEIIAEVNDITVDNVAIGNEVWNQEPERLKNVATVETTGEQFEAFNI